MFVEKTRERAILYLIFEHSYDVARWPPLQLIHLGGGSFSGVASVWTRIDWTLTTLEQWKTSRHRLWLMVFKRDDLF